MDRGARAGLAMLVARALLRRVRRRRDVRAQLPAPAQPPPAVPEDDLPEIERAVDDAGLSRLRGELSQELARRARRES